MDPRAARAEVPSADPELLMALGVGARPVGTCVPQGAAAAHIGVLHELLEDATGAGVVDEDDCQLLLRLAEHLGLSRDEVMAFGDGQNDVPMLEYAGAGYAMANACPQALACTSLVAPSNAEDGVAQVIERYIKGGQIGSMNP